MLKTDKRRRLGNMFLRGEFVWRQEKACP